MKSRLKALRAERGWTQEQLSACVGVSRYAIVALETERHDPSLDLAFRIAAAFDIPVENVFFNPHGARASAPSLSRSAGHARPSNAPLRHPPLRLPDP